MKLTDHFTLEELVRSDTAVRMGLDNQPPPDVLENLSILAQGLERVRKVLGGVPMHINSGYRGPEVNVAIGGSKNSAHMFGLAADITVHDKDPRSVCQMLEMFRDEVGFEKLIYEGTWTHIAFPKSGEEPKGEVLTAVFTPGYTTTYVKGIV